MTHPTEELRTAAQKLRSLAEKATQGICPDWTYNAVRHIARNCQVDCLHENHQGFEQPEWDRYDDSPYIAAMHPGVGKSIADWLDSAAVDAEQIGADHRALAVARAVNGGEQP